MIISAVVALHRTASAPPGLILGYANLTESQIDTGVRAIAAAVRRPS